MTCPGCRGEVFDVEGGYRGIRAPFLGLQRIRCKGCGLVFADPRPNARELDNYNQNYFASAHGGIPEDPAAIAFFKAIAELRVAHVSNYAALMGVSPQSVLEVGPGPGFFARAWLDSHAEAAYYAQETDADARSLLTGIGVTLVEQDDEIEVDLLVMSHVLEHVADPIGFLEKNLRRLKKRGILFVEVPCRDDLHKSQDEPHLLFFEKDSLRSILVQTPLTALQLTYHGKILSKLRKAETTLSRRWSLLRAKLIAHGVLAPFAMPWGALQAVRSAVGRAVVAPLEAHKMQQEPAWWLRACALKE